MSHFAVMVVGPDVDKQLAPFHEYECTGRLDEFVVEVDDTEEARENWKTNETTRYRDTRTGKLVKQWTAKGDYKRQFVRVPTAEEQAFIDKAGPLSREELPSGLRTYRADRGDGRGYASWVIDPPKHLEEVSVPYSEVETFAEFAMDYYGLKALRPGETQDPKKKHAGGYVLLDEQGEVVKVIDRTNPNKKWDWYEIGGRWNGFFKIKPNAKNLTALGKPGIQTMDPGYTPPSSDEADVIRKGDIDVEAMMKEDGDKAAARYDLFTNATKDLPIALSWDVIREKYKTGVDAKGRDIYSDIDAARQEYHSQPMKVAMNQIDDLRWYDLEDFLSVTREEYIDLARKRSIMTYAILSPTFGWQARGTMLMFGVSADAESMNEWIKRFYSLWESIPDDEIITIVDCHI